MHLSVLLQASDYSSHLAHSKPHFHLVFAVKPVQRAYQPHAWHKLWQAFTQSVGALVLYFYGAKAPQGMLWSVWVLGGPLLHTLADYCNCSVMCCLPIQDQSMGQTTPSTVRAASGGTADQTV